MRAAPQCKNPFTRSHWETRCLCFSSPRATTSSLCRQTGVISGYFEGRSRHRLGYIEGTRTLCGNKASQTLWEPVQMPASGRSESRAGQQRNFARFRRRESNHADETHAEFSGSTEMLKNTTQPACPAPLYPPVAKTFQFAIFDNHSLVTPSTPYLLINGFTSSFSV